MSHETGHLFGLLHPQEVRRADGSTSAMNAVESAHTVMSYQNAGLTDAFGTVDHITWQRNQAAHAVWRAQVLGLEETTAFEEATAALKMYEWSRVQEALEPHIQAADDHVIPAGPRAYTVQDALPETPAHDALFALDPETRNALVEVDS